MKKFAKMSLVAAIVVAGTVASAQPLAEAIKNVDVSGAATYRYDDSNTDSGSSSANFYKITTNLKSKVTDDVTFNSSIQAANNATNDAQKLDTQSGADSNLDIALTKANFSYTGIKNTTIILGKQSIQTPWTASAGSAISFNEQTGTGLVAVSTLGPVTAIGAYFNQTNFDNLVNTDIVTGTNVLTSAFNGSEDVYAAALLGNIGPVALDAWYLALDGENAVPGVDTSFDSYTLGANFKLTFGDVKFGMDLRYTALSFDELAAATYLGQTDEKSSLAKIKLTAKTGIFSAKVAYGVTDKDGGLVALDKHSKAAMTGWLTKLNGQRDSQYLQTTIAAQVLPNLNLALNYNDLDSDVTGNAADASEVFAQLTYKMSKNLTALVRIGQAEYADDSNKDKDAGRLHIIYKF